MKERQFVLVLNWWAESNGSLSPKEINDLFRALTMPTLSDSLDGSHASGSHQGYRAGAVKAYPERRGSNEPNYG
jgi:hypothetical protein